MIVRIMGQGQWVMAPEHLLELNELDRALEGAVEAGDEAAAWPLPYLAGRDQALRLRSRAAEDLARDAEEARGVGDVRLPSTAWQRRHANPRRKGVA